jgi:hypothetical protein
MWVGMCGMAIDAAAAAATAAAATAGAAPVLPFQDPTRLPRVINI